MLSTLSELPGRAGDEVVLPLGNRPRLQQLLSLPEVAGPLGAAFDAPQTAAAGGAGSYGDGAIDVQVFIGNEQLAGQIDRRITRRDQQLARDITAGIR